MKKIFTALIAFSFVIAGTSAVDAALPSVGDPGKSWAIPNDFELGMHVQEFIDSFPGEAVSYLIDGKLQEDSFVDPTCNSVNDARCTSQNLSYTAILPVC